MVEWYSKSDNLMHNGTGMSRCEYRSALMCPALIVILPNLKML